MLNIFLADIITKQKNYLDKNDRINYFKTRHSITKVGRLFDRYLVDLNTALYNDQGNNFITKKELKNMVKTAKGKLKNIVKYRCLKRLNYIKNSYSFNKPLGVVFIGFIDGFDSHNFIKVIFENLICGNSLIIRLPNNIPNTSSVLKLIFGYFDDAKISLLNGDYISEKECLNAEYDLIYLIGNNYQTADDIYTLIDFKGHYQFDEIIKTNFNFIVDQQNQKVLLTELKTAIKDVKLYNVENIQQQLLWKFSSLNEHYEAGGKVYNGGYTPIVMKNLSLYDEITKMDFKMVVYKLIILNNIRDNYLMLDHKKISIYSNDFRYYYFMIKNINSSYFRLNGIDILRGCDFEINKLLKSAEVDDYWFKHWF